MRRLQQHSHTFNNFQWSQNFSDLVAVRPLDLVSNVWHRIEENVLCDEATCCCWQTNRIRIFCHRQQQYFQRKKTFFFEPFWLCMPEILQHQTKWNAMRMPYESSAQRFNIHIYCASACVVQKFSFLIYPIHGVGPFDMAHRSRIYLSKSNRKPRRRRDREDVKPICQFNFAFRTFQFIPPTNIREILMSILMSICTGVNTDDDDVNLFATIVRNFYFFSWLCRTPTFPLEKVFKMFFRAYEFRPRCNNTHGNSTV